MCGTSFDTFAKIGMGAAGIGSAVATGVGLFSGQPKAPEAVTTTDPENDPEYLSKAKATRQRLLAKRGKEDLRKTTALGLNQQPDVLTKTLFGGM